MVEQTLVFQKINAQQKRNKNQRIQLNAINGSYHQNKYIVLTLTAILYLCNINVNLPLPPHAYSDHFLLYTFNVSRVLHLNQINERNENNICRFNVKEKSNA